MEHTKKNYLYFPPWYEEHPTKIWVKKKQENWTVSKIWKDRRSIKSTERSILTFMKANTVVLIWRKWRRRKSSFRSFKKI